MHIYIGVMFLGLVGVFAGAESTWNYSDPICRKSSQSPIDIKNPSCDVKLNKSIEINKYGNPGNGDFILLNNGHVLQLDNITTGANIKLFKDEDTYNLAQLRFHWGDDKEKGSEHTMKGKSYPAELHLVHYNTKYGSLKAAENQTKPAAMGLAVLGVFIEVGTNNSAFEKFLKFVPEVVNANTSVTVKPFAMNELLPKGRDVFYRYNGSLTTPPCYQSVIWTVFDEAIQISKEQLGKFRSLKDSKGGKLVNNFRPVQDLRDRKITYWNQKKCLESGARVVEASILTVLLSVLLFFTA